MRTSLPPSFAKIILLCCFTILAMSSAFAAVNGAIYTTNSTGTKVNGNLYPAKTAVYLNGGPQNTSDPGLTPGSGSTPAYYYFQVTDPSGAVLLSADDISCREVEVQNGRIVALASPSCPTDPHLTGTLNTSNGELPVQLCPAASAPPRADTLSTGNFDPNNWCDTTPNPGGEYKAWLTPVDDYIDPSTSATCPTGNNVHGFCDSESKTDNFKVQFTPTPPPPPCDPSTDPTCPGPPPPSAKLVACKYWDKDDDGMNEGPDVLLSGWTITATADATNADTLVITNGQNSGTSASGVTDDTGCTTFTVTGFPTAASSDSVTLNETLQTGWNQVAPLQGSYAGGTGGAITVTGCNYSTAPIPACTSTSDVPLIGDGTTTVAPDFGNTGLDLIVSKSASPAYTRTYSWGITKTVSGPGTCTTTPEKCTLDQLSGTATYNYVVTATESEPVVDSGWQVTGSITVTNPNGFEVDGVTVNENGDGKGGACSFNAPYSGTSITGINLTAAGTPGATASYGYTCTYTSNPGSGTNDATATWPNTYNTPDTSADSGTSGAYTFGSPTTTINQTVSVTDTYAGTLGSLTATDTPTAPSAVSGTYKYSRTFTVSAGCTTYPNTARVVLTTNPPANPTASASVEVCGPAATGGLTMGFWQNKNGQGIIGAANQTNLGNWLRFYHPFSDAPSTGLATYVYNIIKVATCSGPSTSPCNKMLRAQMLATALDVYFSDPTLGGNKISAPHPIGGVQIDLTHVCNMIDGSGGTATCSGTFYDVSAQFGGTCLTVSAMLLYQNTSDPTADAGAVWYGNLKTPQVNGKNAFDAINNRVAFNCP
jgi:hypothetical protein